MSHVDENGIEREYGKVCAIENERLDEIETSKFGVVSGRIKVRCRRRADRNRERNERKRGFLC